ncbi:hypothetical protein ElyMa_005301100 [Elysia marginata]|uniref:Uncharacterized protein n=1 Tax=Elysia marginata TaxID=1093978 RepID=A0AAV4K4J6_9GAST|nr:hypothetical protein ElyMa_005301100 [Elysia marginata]
MRHPPVAREAPPARLHRDKQNIPTTTGRTSALLLQPAVTAELLPVNSFYPSQPSLLSARLRIYRHIKTGPRSSTGPNHEWVNTPPAQPML